MRVPVATYRLQLNAQFTFKDAENLLDYFAALGISDLYLSPINTAPPESTHNYDVWSYEEINSVLGGRAGLESLAAAAKKRGIGLLVDFVPNHMGIAGNGNLWWRDVLKNGDRSEYQDFFDIHWRRENGVAKVVVPVLGDFLKNVIDRGELQIKGDELVYFEHTFPIAPSTKVEGDPVATLAKQHYSLIHWRHGTEQINYRRFFEVNTLAGVAVEKKHVFDRVHALLIDLIRAGTISGIRLDHIDGLACPNQYLARLKEAVGAHFYVLVEKILAAKERLPGNWPVAGTTGYDFMILLGQLFIDRSSQKQFDQMYGRFSGVCCEFEELVVESKAEVLRTLFYSEFQATLRRALALATRHPLYCDLSPRAIEGALEQLIAHLPVYRTYLVCGEGISKEDCEVIDQSAANARQNLAKFFHPAIDFFVEVWTTDFGGAEGNDFRARLQQLTGPVMAKGVEDTAFYRYHRLIALNEVGGDPARFGIDVSEFHAQCRCRAKEQPSSMLATSTHDTKFSEDFRARMSVLSEIPDEWARFVEEWKRLNPGNPPLGGNDEYRLLQALAGIWPFGHGDAPLPETLVERIINFLRKSLREAKLQTTWLDPDEDWEKTVFDYVRGCLASPKHRKLVSALAERIAPFGALNSLSQTLIKLTAPGAPDIYQGNEIWDFSMVDPDNRRPIDYALRKKLLAPTEKQSPTALLQDWASGAIKLKVIRDTLSFRRNDPDLFTTGAYEAIQVEGEFAEHCVAFQRVHGGRRALIAAPRLCVRLGFPAVGKAWKDTRLLAQGSWRNAFTGETVGEQLTLSEIFRSFPVALLEAT